MGGNRERFNQGTYIKDIWTKPKGGCFEDGRQGWAVVG